MACPHKIWKYLDATALGAVLIRGLILGLAAGLGNLKTLSALFLCFMSRLHRPNAFSAVLPFRKGRFVPMATHPPSLSTILALAAPLAYMLASSVPGTPLYPRLPDRHGAALSIQVTGQLGDLGNISCLGPSASLWMRLIAAWESVKIVGHVPVLRVPPNGVFPA